MNPESIAKLEAKKKYLEIWLDGYRKAQEVVPFVQMSLELAEWEIQAFRHSPDEADEIPLVNFATRIDRDYNQLTGLLPPMPEYKIHGLINSTAVTTSGSAVVYEYVSRVGDLSTPDAQAYSAKFTGLYHAMQDSQGRSKAVRSLIEKLGNLQTLERFDRASSAYFAVKSNTGTRTVAGAEMRTLLDGIKGDLFAKAKKWPDENMSWDEMAIRLSDIGQQELVEQEKTRSSLISRLSDVLKDREGGSPTNLEAIWTQLLDHIYTVLGLINF